MKNYQRAAYSRYYIQTPDGDYISCTRQDCFAPAKEANTPDSYKQRWFYDPEAGYAIRLRQTAEGDALGKRNAADLKAEDRQQARKVRCIWKGTNRCDQNCGACTQKQSFCTVELDKPWNTDSGEGTEINLDFADDAADVEAILKDRELLSCLMNALRQLSPDDQLLWQLMMQKAKKQDVAERFNLTLDGVYYREKRLRNILRSDESLKGHFEKS